MKTTRLLQLFFLLALSFGWLNRASAFDTAAENDYVVAESPDHPKTWVTGATREHQGLRWSPEKHLLFGEVTYSTADFADGPHPTEEDNYALAFPTVHFDPASGKFTAGGVHVATLRHGLFGDSVELAPNAELSIHRHHGVIFGKLLADRED